MGVCVWTKLEFTLHNQNLLKEDLRGKNEIDIIFRANSQLFYCTTTTPHGKSEAELEFIFCMIEFVAQMREIKISFPGKKFSQTFLSNALSAIPFVYAQWFSTRVPVND